MYFALLGYAVIRVAGEGKAVAESDRAGGAIFGGGCCDVPGEELSGERNDFW